MPACSFASIFSTSCGFCVAFAMSKCWKLTPPGLIASMWHWMQMVCTILSCVSTVM